jgi:hypothetical protein
MVELTLKSGRDDRKDRNVAGTLDQYGVHVAVNTDFFERRDMIESHIDGYLSDEEIEAMHLTPKRELLLKQAMRKFKSVWYHGPSGKGAENGRFYRAMAACRNLILRVEESIDCDASDDDVYLNGRDILSTMDDIIMATFGRENTTVMTSFVVQTPPPGTVQQPMMTPVQQLTGNSQRPSRGSGEYAGRNVQG